VRVSRLPPPYDEVDRTIVEILSEDGRITIPALAERAGVSRSTAYARLGRLRSDGIITGFRATVAAGARGLPIAALVLIRADQNRWNQALQQLRDLPGVEWVAATAARFDFVALVRAADLHELRDVVLEGLRAIPTLTTTETVILLDEAGSV